MSEAKPVGVPPSNTQSELGLQVMGMPSDVRCFSLALGWDDSRFWKPFVALTVFKVAFIIGWHKREEDTLVRYDRQAVTRAMRRDYWWVDQTTGNQPYKTDVAKTHDPESDTFQPYIFPNLLEEAGIADGDEFEILVTATGERPHGDRRFLRFGKNNTRPETDDECLKRIEADGR